VDRRHAIPKPIVVLFYPGTSYTVTHLRCYEIASLVDVTSATDWDRCIAPGCPFPDGWAADRKVRVRRSDNGAGGQFRTLDSNGNFVPLDPVLNAEQITHYRASWDRPGIVHITLEVDDAGLYYNDEPSVVNDPDNGNVTVWEFEIDPPYIDALPQDGAIYTFTATIRPEKDHKGQSMVRFIEFWLYSSAEPGYCLNATRVQGLWTDTSPEDNDLKFVPYQPGLEVYAHPFDPNPTNFCYAVTTQPVLSASVQVLCLDYGANGIVLAYVYGLGPNLEPARLKGYLDRYVVQIPKDEDGNLIWDGWGWNNGGTLDDNDAEPPGDGTLGDGLTRYEEYRGLEVDGLADDNSSMNGQVNYQRLNPTCKDMFVVNGVRWISRQFGAGYFPGAGMPNTWLVDFDRLPDKNAFVINFFSSPLVRIRPVYGIQVVEVITNVWRGFYGFCTQPIWSEQRVNEPLPVSGTGPSAVYLRVQIEDVAPDDNAGIRYVIGHEIGHSVLWHQPNTGHHPWEANNQQVICLMSVPADFNVSPSEFCDQCQGRWRLNP
jgi:hypothetical protein